ncbi:MAG: nickel/cobalt efflux protein RcnA [Gemmataceae bacterium]|nr:nickel/cobalt efflux protein RcnA [Gemmataceae bacterium]
MDASILYLPSAIGLGALHALEPGHAKTLTAAYLIGTKGTKRDAVLLGVSVAFTHSIVVILLAVAGVWLGREAFTDQATYWLQAASSGIVILLGCYLLYRRWPRKASLGLHPDAHHHAHPAHHHAPDPFRFSGSTASGTLAVADTPEGERFRLEVSSPAPVSGATVRIIRPHNVVEEHALVRQPDGAWAGEKEPAEPHEFDALLELEWEGQRQELVFSMTEPKGHAHALHDDHGLDADELAHARAHAATLPDYARRGERPTVGQIIAFGAAGGLVPCPAAVTVMLLAISVSRTGNGLLMVLGFSIGLAITLVGIGLAVVTGLNALGAQGRFAWLSRRAPVISAAVVVLSGAAALAITLAGSLAH